MTANVGRNIAMTWGGSAIGGVRQKAITIDGAPVNVSADEDAGWQVLLTVAGEQSVTISVSGVTKNKVLKTDWFAGNRTKTMELTYWLGDEISGSFYLANYKETGPYQDAVTFEAEFQSTGAVTYTPGA